MPRNLRALVLLPLLAGTVSCALIPGPNLHQLKLTSVRVVSSNEVPNFVPIAKAALPERSFLVLNFSAERDLVEYAKRYEYNIVNDASICRDDEIDTAKLLQNDVYIYDPAGAVNAFRKDESEEASASAGYNVYIAMKPIPLASRSVFEYDLQHNPENICVQLKGGNMLGDSFVSNVIVVPKSAISDALTHR